MTVRALLVMLAGSLFVAYGCGAPNGEPGEPGAPGAEDELAGLMDDEEIEGYDDLDEDELPEWARGLEAGDPPPEETEYSDEAETAFVQADLAGEDDPDGRDASLRDALDAAERGIEADPENPIHYFLAGQAAMMLEEYVMGAEFFDEAEARHEQYRLDTEPFREEAWIELYNDGVDILDEGQEDQAIAMFEEAHQVYQQRPEGMLNLAAIYHDRGELEEAQYYYGHAVEVIEGPRAQELEEEDRELWEEQVEPARFNRAQINIELGNYSEAAEDYEALLEDDPDNVMALSNLSVAYMQMGEEEQAREIYEELFEQEDLMQHELLMIGVGFYEGQDFQQAAEAFDRIRGEIPEHREALAQLVQTYHDGEYWEELQGIGDEAIAADSHNPVIYQLVAQGYVHTDQEQEAVEYLEQMEQLPFWLLQMHMTPQYGDGAVVQGQLQNQALDPGTPIEVEFTFYDGTGQTIGSETMAIEAPGQEEVVPFDLQFAHDEEVGGYSYEVVSP